MTEEHAAAPRLRDGMRAALPLAPSPILFGLSYGVLADATGFGRVAAIVMSATTFAGASQFASISVFDAGGTVVAAVLAAIFLNARYAAISLTVASIFPGGRLRRLVESQAIVDESWALSGRRGRFERPILVGAGLLLYILWVGSTALGTVIGGSWAIRTPSASTRLSRRSSSPWRCRTSAIAVRARPRRSRPGSRSR